ncbi:MAG: alpha/beta hydrolase [Chryseosolibacter sp.]
MNNKLSALGATFLLCVTVLTLQSAVPHTLVQDKIEEEGFIMINGIAQWVTIKGDKTKPVILFLHGGPGSTMSPYADAVYGSWEKDFILVQWDQRGAGKTYGHDAPAELTPEYLQANPLTVAQITADGIALAEYLIKHLGKEKIILVATSWGSVPGVQMSLQRPDLFHAYIGHAQVVNPAAGMVAAYHTVQREALGAADTASLQTLENIGLPPYRKAKSLGQLLRIVKKYERKKSVAAPEAWWVASAKYENEKDARHRADGDDYSFVNFAGDEQLGVESMMPSINRMKDALNFDIPVYFIQGAEDILTPKEMTEDYFNKITAPKKEFILLPDAAHGHNRSVVEMQYEIVTKSSIRDK